MELNTYSSVHMIQLARPYLAKTKGEIVNVSSIGGQPKGTPRWIYYAMAKGALDQLTRGLAVELISEGIRVNSISPGTTETNFCITAGMPEGSKEKLTEMSESSPDILPIRKVAQPEEMASIIAFLADRRRSRYIIGQTIVADGGALLVLAANASVDFLEK
ncbi:3-oxoacyl-[acyl-carrier-protein] reductase domain protein [Oesophagostomum dentatum]|uniref:3-oxoacyl-[acyl-carrier-protein] reductase domain protein n=1 Tax=Oesophagostomum dentatum TaxID=61180 RepID=A0A0B1SJH7_OESDE|nr:3-oxoacyl-[acyl-carrier-protein] reductase domain protein [Oesophagostomum dentatum]